ncbi:hypothetical protein M2132_000169 [Dysgonomonas sp. PH5-45]|uniref:glycosyltransferase family 39 protein n=1 Tax=unclassified Dysgonomonas TaxID=2630389 RepID=UPI002476BADD|nr:MULTISPECIES: glycosyltransferase family 39 protein [unclassified Dysgonomonas]MDH6353852.1 hypothetical protein [Dysgonomonas sp. PH5-45]MDH6386754.1 hypothetical protein [Dysgonomonas sp. PH5-37]
MAQKGISFREQILSEKGIFLCLFVYNALLLFLCSRMSPLYDFNAWSDINVYFTIGKGWMNGLLPYRDLFDHKGPLIFLIYGIGYLISNTAFWGVYIIEVLFFFIGGASTYLIALFFLKKTWAFGASVIFSLLTLWYSGWGGAAEEFVLMAQMLGLYLFFRYFIQKDSAKPSLWHMLAQGVIFAFIFFIKFNLAVFLFFLLLAIFFSQLQKKQYADILKSIAVFLCGFCVVALPFVAYFHINSALNDFMDGYFTFNMRYSGKDVNLLDIDFVLGVAARFAKSIAHAPLFFGVALLGMLVFCLTPFFVRNIYARLGVGLTYLVFSAVVFMTPVIMEYYYISLAVFPFLGYVILLYFLQHYLGQAKQKIYYGLFALLGLGIGCAQKQFFGESIEVLTRQTEPQTVETKFSDILKKDSQSTLLSLGLDRGMGVFTKANVVPDVKYFFYPNIRYEAFPLICDSQVRYVQEGKPRYIVMCSQFIYSDYFLALPEFNEKYREVATFHEDNSLYSLYKLIETK